MIDLFDEDIQKVLALSNDVPVFIKYYHNECPMCVHMTEIYDLIYETYKYELDFYQYMTRHERNSEKLLCKVFGILTCPAIVILKDGEEVAVIRNRKTFEEYKEIIDKIV